MNITTHKEIIELWPSIGAICTDTGEKLSTVKQWKYRNSIPSEHWKKLINAAHQRDIELSYKTLAEAAAK